MRFGEPVDDDRYAALLRPDQGIRTILTADVYGEGAADALLGRALAGVPRESYALAGAIGHDFYTGERIRLARHAFQRAPQQRVRLPLAIDVGGQDRADTLVRTQERGVPLVIDRLAEAHEAPAAPRANRRAAQVRQRTSPFS